MRAVVQRVSEARVVVNDEVVGKIGVGLLVFLGITAEDGSAEVDYLARKLTGLRIFEDSDGKMNLALADVGGAVLAVSQFTLYGNVRKGRRPSFVQAARPELAEPLYQAFCTQIQAAGFTVAQGIFGAEMQVQLVNSGPVTLILDSAELMR